MQLADEQRRKARGRRGETLAAWLLRARGMRVLARNVVVRGAGEVDVLGREGRTLILVEVKSRRAGGGEEAVGWQRQRALRRCAECLLADPDHAWADEVRFDVVAVDAWRARYLRDAF
jgi:putative endonuclease